MSDTAMTAKDDFDRAMSTLKESLQLMADLVSGPLTEAIVAFGGSCKAIVDAFVYAWQRPNNSTASADVLLRRIGYGGRKGRRAARRLASGIWRDLH
jgi:hypothetical protein